MTDLPSSQPTGLPTPPHPTATRLPATRACGVRPARSTARRRALAGRPREPGEQPSSSAAPATGDGAAAGTDATGPVIDAVPVLPLAAAVTDGEPRHRLGAEDRSPSASASLFVLGVLLAVGIGNGVLYAWGQQYDGRVLPGVRIGSTDIGGLTRDQAAAAIAQAYASLGEGQITLTGPDGQIRPSAMPTWAAGPTPRRCSMRHSRLATRRTPRRPHRRTAGRNARRDPRHRRHLRPRQAGGRRRDPRHEDDQAPVDASVSAGEGGTFSVSPAKDGRAVDRRPSGGARPAARGARHAGVDHDGRADGGLAPAVATASAEGPRRPRIG